MIEVREVGVAGGSDPPSPRRTAGSRPRDGEGDEAPIACSQPGQEAPMHVPHLDPDPASLWVDRLLERRSDLTLVELEQGRSAVIRRDELLVLDPRHRRSPGSGQALDRRYRDRRGLRPRAVSAPARAWRPASRARARTRRRDLEPEAGRHPEPPHERFAWRVGWWPGRHARADHLRARPPGRRATDRARRSRSRSSTPGCRRIHGSSTTDWFGAVEAQDIELLDELPKDHLLDAQAGHGTFIIGVIMQRGSHDVRARPEAAEQ